MERKVESMVFPSWNQLQKEAHRMQVESLVFPSWNQLQKEAHGMQVESMFPSWNQLQMEAHGQTERLKEQGYIHPKLPACLQK